MTALPLEALVDSIPTEIKRKRRRRHRQVISNEQSSISSGENSFDNPVRKQNNTRRRRPQNGSKSSHKEEPQTLTREEKEKYVAIDCEMVGTGYGGQRSSLARVCIIGWDGEPLLDLYVRQRAQVTDYRTFVSGITEDDLSSENAVDIEDCREQVLNVLEGKILVGHALKNDLSALCISHPWQQIRDTAKYEPFMKVRFDDGILWPRKLKDLAKEKLGKEIQEFGRPHCPFEDAKTAMDLYQKARNKWEKAMEYKIRKTLEIELQQTSATQ